MCFVERGVFVSHHCHYITKNLLTNLMFRKLLNEILSGEEAEIVVEKIHDILRDISEKMREDKIPAQKYIIYTKLGKNPKEYPNPDSMPQVQVALRAMAQGKTVRVNDVMAYIVTGDSKTSSENAAKRAYAPQDVLKLESGLKPGIYIHSSYLLGYLFFWTTSTTNNQSHPNRHRILSTQTDLPTGGTTLRTNRRHILPAPSRMSWPRHTEILHPAIQLQPNQPGNPPTGIPDP